MSHAHDFPRVHDFYLQLHDLHHSTSTYPYDLPLAPNPSAAPPYELTVSAEGGCGDAAGALVPGQPHQPHSQQRHDPRKRKDKHFGTDPYEMSNSDANLSAPAISSTRKRRGSYTSNSSAAPQYELPSGADGNCSDASSTVVPHQHSSQHRHDTRKRKDKHFGPDCFEMSNCDISLPAPAIPSSRKRKGSSYGAPSTYDDDDGEDSRSTITLPDKKQNHSEIEKRRRDKMNTYITELSAMIPMCGAMARKLDKLTVLRMAVQHLRSVRGALSACPLSARPRPAFLSERELNALILLAAHDCFLLVVGCDRGRLLYVSASVKRMLQYDQSELLGQSLFDILHPKDVAKVKEQLSSSYLSPRERLIDAKTMLPVKTDHVAGASRLCPGARRSFLCRIKCKLDPEPPNQAALVKEEADAAKMRKKNNEKRFCVVQCTGYLKLGAPMEVCGAESGDDGDGNMSCLVAVARALPDAAPPAPSAFAAPVRRQQFVSRHATDGKFVFVDQRVTLALGFLPQELLDTSLYEYVGSGELGAVARTHKAALLSRDALHTPPYGFRRKDGSLARVQTHFKPFKNPWTKDVEYLVANNTILGESDSALVPDAEQASFDVYKHKVNATDAEASTNEGASDFQSGVSELDLEMQQLIDSQVDSHKIGSAIATEALRRSSPDFSPDLPPDVLQDAVFSQQSSLVDNIFGVDLGFNQVRNNVSLSAASGENSPPPGTSDLPQGSSPSVSPPLPSLGLDGNGEAAMAVIMSLLEADAGLGGPVNFSGLPWPLP